MVSVLNPFVNEVKSTEFCITTIETRVAVYDFEIIVIDNFYFVIGGNIGEDP